MLIVNEYPERYGWWINELKSLGISTKKTNELNDLKEIRNLTENIKPFIITTRLSDMKGTDLDV